MHISKLSSIVNAHALITLPSYPEIKITDWDYADEWKTGIIKKKENARIVRVFIARTACRPWFGDSLLIPVCIIKLGSMYTQHALAIPAG